MVTSGFDIDCRVTPADELMLAKLWRSRCTTSKLRAPYFMVSSVESKHRPTALHMAVLFNALECVQILLDNGADANLPVWFCDIREVEGKLTENNTLSQKQTQRIFNARQLVDAVFQRNVHRLTEDLVTKKVANWKKVVTVWCKRLAFLFDSPRGSNRLSVEEIDRRVSAMGIDGEEVQEGEEEASELGSVSASLSLNGNPKMSSKGASRVKPTKSTKLIDGVNLTPMDEDSAGEEGGAGDGQGNENENGEDYGGSTVSSKAANNGGFRRDKVIPPKSRMFSWRQHSMVEKLQGKPIILEVAVPVVEKVEEVLPVRMKPMRARETIRSGMVSDKYRSTKIMDSVKNKSNANDANANANWTGEGTVVRNEIIPLPLLGAQSHWLESRALVIRDREAAYESTLLPEIHHRPDAVERAVVAAASLRPAPPVVQNPDGELNDGDFENENENENEESEDVIGSGGANTPAGFASSSSYYTPFVMSPPGTAAGSSSSSRATSSQMRTSFSRDGFSNALVPLDEFGGFRPDSAQLAATASMKRLSSSERRDRFLQQLSQRIEDRFNPDV